MAKYFDKFSNDFKNLCSPAFVYLFISVIAFIVCYSNFGNTTKYCLGPYECYLPNTFLIFVFKTVILYFVFYIKLFM